MVDLWTCRSQVRCQTYIQELRVVQLKNLWLTCGSSFSSLLTARYSDYWERIKLLATLTDSQGHIQISQFCKSLSASFCNIWQTWMSDDRVRPQTEEEEELYKLLSEVTQKPASLLRSKWREPSLTIHNIEISGPKSETNLRYVHIHDHSLIQ